MSRFSSYSSAIHLATKGENDIINITHQLNTIIKESKVDDGIINVVIPGATGALTTIEHEPGLLNDFPILMDDLIPKKRKYSHNEWNYDDNGHSHCRASLIGPSITLNFRNKSLIVGTWQQVVFLEFDTRSRNRKIDVMIIGIIKS